MKVLFWRVNNKSNAVGEAPVYCRITIDGRRAEINTGVLAKDVEFDTKKGRLKENSEAVSIRNKQLDHIGNKLNKIHHNERLNDKNPSAQAIKALFFASKRNKIYLLADMLNTYRDDYFKMYAKDTTYKLHGRYINLIMVALVNIDKKNAQLHDCDPYFLDQLVHYIVNKLNYSVAYTKKTIGFLKSALLYGFNRQLVDSFKLHDYKMPIRKKTKVVYLEEYELAKITKHTFKSEAIQRSADLFVVQAYTGLAYADLKRLNPSHFIKDTEGLTWINITRKKVDTAECVIPVITKAWNILKKYDFKLPIISNQKYNNALKKIATEVGINKCLTSHVGRKTYGTLLLNKDVPIETVRKLLGHSSTKITEQHYAKVLHMKVARDVRRII